MRVVAILASYNEELYIRACFDNFIAQGCEIYLIDNDSTDATVEIAREYLGKGLINIEHYPRDGVYRWHPILLRKEEIADELKADWYIHADPDEIRLPPTAGTTLVQYLESLDRANYNAVNFKNFLFLPTLESPNHEHEKFEKTMLWYRYMEPSYPNQIKAWKRQTSSTPSQRRDQHLKASKSLGLADHGGHKVEFEGLRLAPVDFIMKHYQVLSLPHAIRKYVTKRYAADEVDRGWHGWKASAQERNLRLPSQSEMRQFIGDEKLDTSEPITRTLIFSDSPVREQFDHCR